MVTIEDYRKSTLAFLRNTARSLNLTRLFSCDNSNALEAF